jgi:hypothetical protein
MQEGKGEFEWAQTSNILALQLNINRKKGAPPIDAQSLNPFAEYERKKNAVKFKLNAKESGEVLRTIFCKK